MDLLSPLVTDRQLAQLNFCRQFLQVTLLSEIITADSTQIIKEAWAGDRPTCINPRSIFPYQPDVPNTFWDLWRNSLQKICGRDQGLLLPLGHWLHSAAPTIQWWFGAQQSHLYQRNGDRVLTFQRSRGRPTRQAQHHFDSPSLGYSCPAQCATMFSFGNTHRLRRSQLGTTDSCMATTERPDPG